MTPAHPYQEPEPDNPSVEESSYPSLSGWGLIGRYPPVSVREQPLLRGQTLSVMIRRDEASAGAGELPLEALGDEPEDLPPPVSLFDKNLSRHPQQL